MFNKVELEDWENLVKKQLKTDEIYDVLKKENLEGIEVKPYYADLDYAVNILPKAVESTHLVSRYRQELENDVFAFLLYENVENLTDKALFINSMELAKIIAFEKENQYIALVDVINDQTGEINQELGTLLLTREFNRKITIDISLHQNAGASIVQQLGIALAKAKELIEFFGKDVLKTCVFRLSIASSYFFEVAKIRALKILVNQLGREFDLDEVPYVFAETSLRNKAKHDKENNLIRSTLELSAAMIGGADAVFTNDFSLDNSTELSQEISFKQQIVLAYESIINVFDDAANGSYYVEDVTHQICVNAWRYFLKIEDQGGYLTSLKSGKIAEDIYHHAYQEQKWVEEGKIKLIGVNQYPKLDKTKSADEMYDKSILKPVRWAEMFE